MNISHLFLRYIINKRYLLELKYLKSGMFHNSFTLSTTILTSHVILLKFRDGKLFKRFFKTQAAY